MNLLIVFALAGDSTMTRLLDIAEGPKLRPRVTIFRGASAGCDSTHGVAEGFSRLEPAATLLLVLVIIPAGRLVLLGLVVERLVGNAEDLGGLAAVAVGHVQRLFDDHALDLLHRLSEGDGDGVLRPALARAEELVREALHGQGVAAGHDEGAVDDVAQ